MTAIEKSHFFFEAGKALENVLDALDELDSVHENWLQDAKEALEKDTRTGYYTVSLPDIQAIKNSFLEGDIFSTYFGINQLCILFYRKKHYFDDSKSEEEQLNLELNKASETFRKYADSYVEDRLSTMREEDEEAFYRKLRRWSLIRGRGANSTNEISALICKESTTKPHPILLEVSLAKEVHLQALYQNEYHLKDLPEDEQRILKAFIVRFESAELQSWRI
jgi:hypothetical protein